MIDARVIEPQQFALVRYGAVPEVIRCDFSATLARGDKVVVETANGPLIGQVLELVTESSESESVSSHACRPCRPAELAAAETLREKAQSEWADWAERIREWKLQLELVDLEWTADGSRLVLYVLNDRGSDTTQLALLAAGKGHGLIHVQPVNHAGMVPVSSSGGGCGSCSHG